VSDSLRVIEKLDTDALVIERGLQLAESISGVTLPESC